MSTYETVVVIGMALWIAIALGILVLLFYIVALVRKARGPMDRVAGSVEELRERLQPVVRNAERASEDVNYIVSVLRTDAEAVGSTVRRVSEATDRMVEIVEERVAEIGGLLEVVQEEAEDTFYSTASLLRGVRRGREAADRLGAREASRVRERRRAAGAEEPGLG